MRSLDNNPPYLINYFDLNKVKFIKIEEKIDSSELNDLQKVCTAFNDYLMQYLNETNN